MHEREKCCCFTGHRPAKLPRGANEVDPRCAALKNEISARLDGIYETGCRHFICGMALGCDMYFAAAVIALRRRYHDVTLEAAIPCASQAARWNAAQRALYDSMLAECDEVSILQHGYTPDCMQARNKYMVDSSAVLLACFDGRPGGTMNTILYARRQGVQTVIIDI